jgi:hypothetical protein
MTAIPRNAPCPRGSGRKYKRCCLGRDETGAARGAERRVLAREIAVSEGCGFRIWAEADGGGEVAEHLCDGRILELGHRPGLGLTWVDGGRPVRLFELVADLPMELVEWVLGRTHDGLREADEHGDPWTIAEDLARLLVATKALAERLDEVEAAEERMWLPGSVGGGVARRLRRAA